MSRGRGEFLVSSPPHRDSVSSVSINNIHKVYKGKENVVEALRGEAADGPLLHTVLMFSDAEASVTAITATDVSFYYPPFYSDPEWSH